MKTEVRLLYPPGHAFREAILREPDTLPRDDVTAGKMLVYLRLLHAARWATRSTTMGDCQVAAPPAPLAGTRKNPKGSPMGIPNH